MINYNNYNEQNNMKTILIDAWNTFITPEGVNREIQKILEEFSNKKIILTSANEEEKIQYGIMNMPYEVFSLKHQPNKDDPEYYKKMLKHFNLVAKETIYFEHNPNAAEAARSVGINTFWYNKDQPNLDSLKTSLLDNL